LLKYAHSTGIRWVVQGPKNSPDMRLAQTLAHLKSN
jgi:hypothetical protein